MRERKSIFNNIDFFTIFLYLVMITFGWINIYAADSDELSTSIFNFEKSYGRQFIWILAALILGFIVLVIDGKFFSTFAYVFYALSVLLLIAVLGIGATIQGSRSWIQIGGFSIQPSEFAKFATALALAKYLSTIHVSISKFKDLIKAGAIIFFPAVLILLQHDTGSALVYIAFIFVLFREGLSGKVLIFGLSAIVLFIFTLLLNKYILIGGLLVLLLLLIFVIKTTKRNLFSVLIIFILGASYIYSVDYTFENILQDHQRNRIEVLIGKKSDPRGVGYNVNQSKIAIGSGGVSGKGFLKGTQTKFDFVPEQNTDFIFCTVGEEWGFMGSLFVIGMFVILLLRIISLAERQRSQFSRIYGYGVASILFFHFTVNIGMTIGMAPVIGIPLPFFSYGGSSLWAFTILLFIFIRQDASRLEVF